MKTFFTFFTLAALLFLNDIGIAQSFETGKIAVTLSNYGRIRVAAPDLTVRQIDRSSILISKSPTEVFDYLEDTGIEIPAETVANPQISDFEVYVKINSDTSNRPPSLLVDINVYGWNNEGYLLAKFTAFSREANAYMARWGMEIIPQIDGTYGNELCQYTESDGFIRMSKSKQVGYYAATDMHSVNMFEWFAGYNRDTSLYRWMSDGNIDAEYLAGGDGASIVFGSEEFDFNPAETKVLWMVIGVGDNELDLNVNMQAGLVKLAQIITSVEEENSNIISGFSLKQNYPNPFNPSTTISYQLKEEGKVNLKIFDIAGNEIAELVNEIQSAGFKSVSFDASTIPSGTYFYRLSQNGNVQTKKMTLIK